MKKLSPAQENPLFAPLSHLGEALPRLARAPEKTALSEGLPYRKFAREAELLALAWRQLGAEPGDRVVLLGRGGHAMLRLELALAATRLVAVPLHPASTAETLERAIRDTSARWLVCEDLAQAERFSQIRHKVSGVDGALVLDPAAVRAAADAKQWISPAAFLELGRRRQAFRPDELERVLAEASPEDLSALILTPGTLGSARFIPITHRAQIQNLTNLAQALTPARLRYGKERVLSVQPSSHVFGRLELWLSILCAWRIEPCARRDQLAPEFSRYAPTLVFGGPRLFGQLRDEFLALHPELSPAPQANAEALDRPTPERGLRLLATLPARVREKRDGRRLHSLWKEFSGGALRFCFAGGAPLSSSVLRFYQSARQPLVEGYGLTETAGPVALRWPTQSALQPGCVGRPLPGNEFRIDEQGQIWVRSNSAATWEWFPTGDLGRLDSNGALWVLDRVPDQLKLEDGTVIWPRPIEASLEEHPWIEHAHVHGEGRPYLTALLSLHTERLLRFAHREGLFFSDFEALIATPRVQSEIRDWVEEVNTRLPPAQRILRFLLLPRPFGIETGELTTTRRVIRSHIQSRHAEALSSLYSASATP